MLNRPEARAQRRIGVASAIALALATIGALAAATASAYVTIPATIWTIAGNGYQCATPTGACGDGPSATLAQLHFPQGVAVDGSGSVYVADTNDSKVRKVTRAGAISTLAGNGNACATPTGACGDGPNATSAALGYPRGLGVDGSSNVYIADTLDNKIRKVTPAGVISTIAGNGNPCGTPTGACGDGPSATAAQLGFPQGVAVDGSGNVYIADSADNKIRKVTPNGAISTIAGSGSPCLTPTGACGDGPSATSAQLNYPSGLALDGSGNVYIADTLDNKIRKVTPGGAISTIAGDGNQCAVPTGTCGDGQSAIAAQLRQPAGVAVDGSGNAYVADTSDNKIRRVTPGGRISTLAGDGNLCSNPLACGDGGAGSAAQLSVPAAVAVDSAGQNLFIADEFDHSVRWLAGPQAGPTGPTGADGPRGAAGRSAKVICRTKKKGRKRVKVTCKVTYPKSRVLRSVSARLVRGSRTYAHGSAGGGRVLRLRAGHALEHGRYLVVLRTRWAAGGPVAVARFRVTV